MAHEKEMMITMNLKPCIFRILIGFIAILLTETYFMIYSINTVIILTTRFLIYVYQMVNALSFVGNMERLHDRIQQRENIQNWILAFLFLGFFLYSIYLSV